MVIVQGDCWEAATDAGDDDVVVVVVAVVPLPSSKHLTGLSKSMLCTDFRWSRMPARPTALTPHSLQHRSPELLLLPPTPVVVMCSFWKWAFRAMWRWNRLLHT